MNMVLGGYTLDKNATRTQLSPVTNPDEGTLLGYVSTFLDANGVLVMREDPEPEAGRVDLTLYAENGCYLLLLSESTEDGGVNVRALVDENKPQGFVSFFGESFPEKATTSNLNIVRDAFGQFLKNRSVSIDLMN
ncbi:DUF6911 family protein [Paraburkholderia kururiensis]|jgi:hypothetical protein|uniref:DUF6911 family protein n=1 Tax=Paraburkholderia kururiensis TaxID=984307 RepID=UPI0018F543B3|nr:hypothetical protein [Paraburkholderia kururiensis]